MLRTTYFCIASLLAFVPTSKAAAQESASWAGGYAGLQLGYIDADADVDYEEPNNGNNGFRTTSSASVDGVAGGINAGYNWSSSGPWVYGIEGEYNWADADGSSNETVIVSSFPNPDLGIYKTEINATAALRGRIGYASGAGLFYGTFGIAYVDYDVAYTNTAFPAADRAFSTSDTGWTLGLGYERDLGNKWTARIDYRYSDFGTKTLETATVASGPSKFSSDLSTSEIRVGFTRRF
ncbi:MAG: outer membrane beta-barrel protein [Dinoroseobacter sp.]|nr:outer membrane beta-barrel protein [Dinoroseobacter sp.]